MKAEELRIGNYVKIDMGIGQVLSITESIFSTNYKNEDYNVTIGIDGLFLSEDEENIEGVPLTEEILLKCGFKKINHIHGYVFYTYKRKTSRNCYLYEMPIDIYLDSHRVVVGNFNTKKPIQYLHQLQNLFYAVNGEELNVEL